MADKKKERKNRIITQNVTKFEELVTVKRSVYDWEFLKENPEANFFVACDSEEEAKTLKSSINSSGQNFFMKRKINLLPVVIVVKLDAGGIGVLCSAIAVE